MNLCTKGNKHKLIVVKPQGFTTVLLNAQNIKTFHLEKTFLTNIFISLSYFTNMYCTRGEIR